MAAAGGRSPALSGKRLKKAVITNAVPVVERHGIAQLRTFADVAPAIAFGKQHEGVTGEVLFELQIFIVGDGAVSEIHKHDIEVSVSVHIVESRQVGPVDVEGAARAVAEAVAHQVECEAIAFPASEVEGHAGPSLCRHAEELGRSVMVDIQQKGIIEHRRKVQKKALVRHIFRLPGHPFVAKAHIMIVGFVKKQEIGFAIAVEVGRTGDDAVDTSGIGHGEQLPVDNKSRLIQVALGLEYCREQKDEQRVKSTHALYFLINNWRPCEAEPLKVRRYGPAGK